jgi:serine kinase of HPr protein (carbohydrate metabolism regulator)
MTAGVAASIHASAVQVGDCAVLIRGPSGSGKSQLAFQLILAGRSAQIPPAVLVGDDRVHLQASAGQLVVRPAPALQGLIEIRGLGIRRCAFTNEAIVGLVIDLASGDAERLPPPEALQITIEGVLVPRIPVAVGFSALPIVIAALTTQDGTQTNRILDNCVKGISNHIRPTLASE